MSPGSWFSVALVWLAPMLAAVAAAAEEQGDAGCTATRRCGNVTISAPFWLRDRNTSSCGLLDFEVSCSNSTPVLRTSTPSGFAILDIRYEERVLHVVDVYDSNSTSEKTCHVPGWNTSDKLGVPFRIGTGNLGLILYNCTAAGAAAASRDGELVRMRCGDGSDGHYAFVRGGGGYNGTSVYGGDAVEGCKATVVPVLGSSSSSPGVANASDYERLIQGGFLLTWDAPFVPDYGGIDQWIGSWCALTFCSTSHEGWSGYVCPPLPRPRRAEYSRRPETTY